MVARPLVRRCDACFANRSVAFACLAACVLLGLGCGRSPTEGTVAGTVRVDGKPIPAHARVVLMSMKTGVAAAAAVRADGAFAAEKPLAPGTYVAFLVPGRFNEEAPDSTPVRNPTDGTTDAPAADSVPAKYWDEGTSPWRVDVVPGPNHVVLSGER